MKTLHYQMPNNLSLLHDQIMAGIPALAPVRDDEGIGTPVMTVEGDGSNVWLTVPDDTDEAAVQTVIDAHDASATQRDLKAEALVSATTKLLVLGLTDEEIEVFRSN